MKTASSAVPPGPRPQGRGDPFASGAGSTPQLRDYVRVLRRRRWSVISAIVIILGLAIVLTRMQTPVYSASTRVVVNPLTSGTSFTSVQPVDVQTEAQIVASEPVARRVQKELDFSGSLKTLLSGVSAEGLTSAQPVYSTAQVLKISYASPDAETARDAANAFAEEYISYRRRQARRALITAQAGVQRRIGLVAGQLEDTAEEIDEATAEGNQPLVGTLQTQHSNLTARLNFLQQRLDDLQPTETVRTGGAQVISGASLPLSPSVPNIPMNMAFGLFLGAVAGVAVALMREGFDERLRDRNEVERIMQLPVIASIPKFEAHRRGRDLSLVALSEAEGFAIEAYRGMRMPLQYIASQHQAKSILITSASAGDGKTTVVANLSVVLAQAGLRVIVVSADLRRPTIDRLFRVEDQPGFSTFLSSGSSIWEHVNNPGVPNLRIVPSGELPKSPAALLSSPRAKEGLDTLADHSDFVLIDSPPVLALADAAILGPQVGGVLLVIDADKTDQSAALAAKQQLVKSGATVLGCVLNGVDHRSSPYQDYSAYQAYSEEPDGTNGPARPTGNGSGGEGPRRRRSASWTDIRG